MLAKRGGFAVQRKYSLEGRAEVGRLSARRFACPRNYSPNLWVLGNPCKKGRPPQGCLKETIRGSRHSEVTN